LSPLFLYPFLLHSSPSPPLTLLPSRRASSYTPHPSPLIFPPAVSSAWVAPHKEGAPRHVPPPSHLRPIHQSHGFG
jgi:hypothetical protein